MFSFRFLFLFSFLGFILGFFSAFNPINQCGVALLLCILQFVALQRVVGEGVRRGKCVVLCMVRSCLVVAGGAVRGSWRFMTLQNAIKFN